ncbi:MAG: aconitase family protein, partial [Desulfovibrionales bacterium]|nr:aconitase family protein [Desulfovibrionales bacterium]
AKDIVIKMLYIFSTQGNVGTVIEYAGEGVATLSVHQRATITNMGAEMGVTTSIFPSDKVTRDFLWAQGRGEDWVEIWADEDAAYHETIELNLSDLEPLAACPHSPGNIKPIRELEGITVDQVCIGSCTNSSLRDLRLAGHILKNKKIAPHLSLGVAPGSRQCLQMTTEDGSLLSMIQAGARILESACGFCIGNHFSPKSGGVSLRTSNRNFEGRSGTADAQVYLVSPEMAALAAIHGKIISPDSLDLAYPKIQEPKRFTIDDSMFIFPDPEQDAIDIIRGPNIGNPPSNTAFPQSISGQVTIKLGDHITTDHIMPAGPRLKYRSNIETYSQFVFEPVDKDFPKRCRANTAQGIHNIIVAGESYGQGSSREHAAICPMHLGVKIVLVKGIERIHAANLVNFGILPLIFDTPENYTAMAPGHRLEIQDLARCIKEGKDISLINVTRDQRIPVRCELSQRQRSILLAGGLLNHTTA